MELLIKRNQDKGFLGGMKFTLEAKVLLNEEEKVLIKKYKANKEVLFSSQKRNYTIDDLIFGIKDKVNDISILQKNEDTYINACEYLKQLLNVMKSFGGEYKLIFKEDGIYDTNNNKIKYNDRIFNTSSSQLLKRY